MIGRVVIALCASLLLVAASAPQTRTAQDAKLLVDKAYPLQNDGNIIIARYKENQPITIYLPKTASTKVPVVFIHHGNALDSTSGLYRLWPSHELVANMNAAGIAVAVPVRKGYFSTPGPYLEGAVRCINPEMSGFRLAATAAEGDVVSAVDYVRTLPVIDTAQIYVGGHSAGGFAVGGALDGLEGKIAGAFLFNGGRCGLRGDLFPGIKFAETLFKEAAAASTMPVVFFASELDANVPPASTWRLRDAVCAARGALCSSTVFLVALPGVGHGLEETSAKAFPYLQSLFRNGRP